MRCDDVSTELTARAHDDDVSPDSDLEAEILAHLERCPDCAAHEEALRPVRDLWERARNPQSELELPDNAFARLRTRVLSEPQPRRRSRLLLAVPALAAAAAVLLFAFLVEPAQDDDLTLKPIYGRILVDGDERPTGKIARIEPGRVIENAGGEAARVELGAAVFVLAPKASLSWTEESHFRLISGAMLVRTPRPLTVIADRTRVDVLGTEFTLDRTGSGLAVQVLEGRVRLTGAGSSVEIPKGSRSFCPDGEAPTVPSPASRWPALDWMGRPRLSLEVIKATGEGPIDLLIRIDTEAREEIPLRPFTGATADFLLEIEDPEGRRFPLKILPGMILEDSRPTGHRARFPLVRGHPYRLVIRLSPEHLGDVRGTCGVVASYNVHGPSGDRLWQGRLTSESRRIRR